MIEELNSEDTRPLHRLIAAVVPIYGVSSSGRVDYVAPPTPEQAAQVAQIIADWPATRAALLIEKAAEEAQANSDKTDLKGRITAALARLQDVMTNGGAYTNAQVRAAVVDVAQILHAIIRDLRHRL